MQCETAPDDAVTVRIEFYSFPAGSQVKVVYDAAAG